jgi:non-ribosomal peptide synthetase component F
MDASACSASKSKHIVARNYVQVCRLLALHLREIEVECGNMILLLREKSNWTVAGMIAILMAGGVCIPVDIRQPNERVQRIIETTGAYFVPTSGAMAGKRSALWTTTAMIQEICVPVYQSPSIQSSKVQLPSITPNATAFVFFTPGSTGISKGVVQGHQAVALTAEQISKAMRIDYSTR